MHERGLAVVALYVLYLQFPAHAVICWQASDTQDAYLLGASGYGIAVWLLDMRSNKSMARYPIQPIPNTSIVPILNKRTNTLYIWKTTKLQGVRGWE